MNILITEKEFQEYRKLQQENDRLNKLLRQLVDEETDWQVNNGQVKLEKLQQEKEDLIKWLEDEDKNLWATATDGNKFIKNLSLIERRTTLREILSKLKESDIE